MVATRSAASALTPGLDQDSPDQRITSPRKQRSPAPAVAPELASSSPPSGPLSTGWSHAPTTTTLLWLFISLPLVIWDAGYVFGRPATMPGGWAHAPIWSPYDLYGKVDHMYGFKQYNLGNGFTAAQAALNVVEILMYIIYLVIWHRAAAPIRSRGSASRPKISGKQAGLAIIVGFSASVMTLSKTVLYWLNEYFSGFENVGHNTSLNLIFLWIIPNGAWLVLPSYMVYQFGSEILDGLTLASLPPSQVKRD